MTDFFRVQLGIVSRSDGHSAAKRSAYQACGKIVDYEGKAFDFTRKAAEHVRTVMLTPDGAPEWTREAESLWRRAAAAEKRVDAQEARILDFSMPRAVPAKLWEDCIRHVYEPFVRIGMIVQVDVHDAAASDGGRNVNVHGLATLRLIEGDGFSKRKNREWNDVFRQRNGRAVREAFAARLTAFCQAHGIDYRGDARPNAERDLPDPEPNLPRWNFEAHARTGEMPEALAALQGHRKRRREWEAANAEAVEAALDLKRIETHIWERRQRRLFPSGAAKVQSARWDRRAAVLRAWHKGDWIDAETIPAIASARYDEKRGYLWIDLADGTTLIDRGDAVSMRGPVTWQAALETAAAAERHGWKSVEVSGDEAYKNAVAVACMLRGIEVLNHILSPQAQAVFDRLHAEQVNRSEESNNQWLTETGARNANGIRVDPEAAVTRSSRELHLALTKRVAVTHCPPIETPDTESSAAAYKPSFSKGSAPKRESLERQQSDFGKTD